MILQDLEKQLDCMKAEDNGSGIGRSGDGWVLRQFGDDGGFRANKIDARFFDNELRYTDKAIAKELAFAASIQFKIRAHPKWRGFVGGEANWCFDYDVEDEGFGYDCWEKCCINADWGYFATVADIDECRNDIGEENIIRAMRAVAGLK